MDKATPALIAWIIGATGLAVYDALTSNAQQQTRSVVVRRVMLTYGYLALLYVRKQVK